MWRFIAMVVAYYDGVTKTLVSLVNRFPVALSQEQIDAIKPPVTQPVSGTVELGSTSLAALELVGVKGADGAAITSAANPFPVSATIIVPPVEVDPPADYRIRQLIDGSFDPGEKHVFDIGTGSVYEYCGIMDEDADPGDPVTDILRFKYTDTNHIIEADGSRQFFSGFVWTAKDAAAVYNFARGSFAPQPTLLTLPPTLTFTRASTRTITDHESIVRNILANEGGFCGRRRVENVVADSEDFANGWTLTLGVTLEAGNVLSYTDRFQGPLMANSTFANVGDKIIVTVDAEITLQAAGGYVLGDFVALSNGASEEATMPLTVGRNKVTATIVSTTTGAVQINPIRTANNVGYTSKVKVYSVQIEVRRSGDSSIPSEYVSKGVLAAPWHGYGVDGVLYAKTNNGNTVNGAGVVTSATGTALDLTNAGLSIFQSYTVLNKSSEDLTTADWLGSVTVTANTAIGPDGLMSLDKVEDTSGAFFQERYQSYAVSADTVIRYSRLIVKKKASGTLRLCMGIQYAPGNPSNYIVINPVTGVIDATVGTASGSITDDGRGNWLAEIGVANISNTTMFFDCFPAWNNSGAAGFDASATGFQEIGFVNVRTVKGAPYIKTTNAQVLVAADVPPNALVAVTNGALYVEAIGHNYTETAQSYLASLSDGTNSETIELSRDTSGNPKADVIDGGASQASIDAGTWANGVTGKLAARFATNDFASAFNGGAEVPDTGGTLPTTTTVKVGSRGDGTGIYNGVIKRVHVYDFAKDTSDVTE